MDRIKTTIMNKTLTLITLSALICGVACKRSNDTAAEATPTIDVANPVVDSVTLHKTYPGVLCADREVKLVARVNGYLESKNYKSGDYVKKGTVLFTIESRNYRDAVESARSAVSTAEANLNYAQSRYDALSEALKSDAVSRMEVEEGRSTLEQCKATLKSAKAALTTAETQLSYCTVVAPFDGHISSATYDVGAYLDGEGAPVELASIYADRTLIANFSIDDAATLTDLQHNIQANAVDFNHIPINFNDTLGHTYTGALDYLAPKVDTSTGTLQLQAIIDNKYGELRSGMYVSVDLPTGFDPNAIMIRDASISTDQLGKYVYLVNDSDKVVYTPVTVGALVCDTMRIVEKGISPTDRCVTWAMLKVRDGMTVKPTIVK